MPVFVYESSLALHSSFAEAEKLAIADFTAAATGITKFADQVADKGRLQEKLIRSV